jgi:hypothetical protein
MSAIVATLALLPVGLLVALACALVPAFSLNAAVTFGGTFSGPVGLFAWWVALLVPATIYSALCLRT